MNRLRNMLIAAGVCSFVLTNCSANEHEQTEYGAESVEKIYTSAPEIRYEQWSDQFQNECHNGGSKALQPGSGWY